jgi:dihydroorotate dehydrogenase electron transfer subunit
MNFFRTTVTQTDRPAPGFILLRFAGQPEIEGVPGQFVMVRGSWGNDPILARAFSLVEVGEQGAILVRIVGRGTELLAGMRPGDPLDVLGPAGHGFDFSEPGQTPILVAGGVGVAPILMLAESLARSGVRPLVLYGARASEELVLCERLARSGELAVATEDGSRGHRGYVTELLRGVLETQTCPRVYACGPEGMLEAVATVAVEKSVPCQIALESPMACGKGTCKGCAVLARSGQYLYVCSDGPVMPAEEIYGGEP